MEAGRTLQDDQRRHVLEKFDQSPYPLYLRLAFEEARRWRSFDGIPVGAAGVPGLGADVHAVLNDLFGRLEQPQHHGRMLVSRSLGYLAAARRGLSEDELLDVLSADEEALEEFRRCSPRSPETDRLPVAVWSRLFADLEPYLARRQAFGTVVLSFYHRQVAEAVEDRYLAGDDRVCRHRALADYFRGQEYFLESLEEQRARARRFPPTPRPVNIRKVDELPYHVLEVAKLAGRDDPKAKEWDEVADLLTDWQFLEAKAEAQPHPNLKAQVTQGRAIDMPESALVNDRDAISSRDGYDPVAAEGMTFREHLQELVAMLRPVALAWFLASLVAPWFIGGNLMTAIFLSSAYALPVVYPLLAFQLYRFALPGLYPQERLWVILALCVGVPAVIATVAFALAYWEVTLGVSNQIAIVTALPKALLTIGMGALYILESRMRHVQNVPFPLRHQAYWWGSMLLIICVPSILWSAGATVCATICGLSAIPLGRCRPLFRKVR
ncbi:MAG: hypothetical protein KatS3mg110_0492 [Pirellulaceae bacterium]|nr:MAG: hypothetical protein KatS3mg110_0492 [Pirellulaceae bacterium]